MTAETSRSIRRQPGRPRLQKTEDSILDAAFRELCRSGYHGLTVDSVARRAGVGKPTVYRRYPGKRELASAALSSRLSRPSAVDSGSLKRDIAEMLRSDAEWLRGAGGAPLVGALLAERESDPWLMDMLRREIVRPRQAQYAGAVERAMARGEVNPMANPSLVAMTLWGALIAAALAGASPNTRGLDALTETLIKGIAA